MATIGNRQNFPQFSSKRTQFFSFSTMTNYHGTHRGCGCGSFRQELHPQTVTFRGGTAPTGCGCHMFFVKASQSWWKTRGQFVKQKNCKFSHGGVFFPTSRRITHAVSKTVDTFVLKNRKNPPGDISNLSGYFCLFSERVLTTACLFRNCPRRDKFVP